MEVRLEHCWYKFYLCNNQPQAPSYLRGVNMRQKSTLFYLMPKNHSRVLQGVFKFKKKKFFKITSYM